MSIRCLQLCLALAWLVACFPSIAQAQLPMPAPSFHRAEPAQADPRPVSDSSQSASAMPGQGKMLFGQVGVSEVLTSAVKQQLGLRTGATTDGAFNITAVRDGSPALNGGLQVGDHVVKVERQGDLIALTVEKGGVPKTIHLSLESSAEPPTLSLRLPRPDNSMPPKSPVALNAQRLAAFVDRSQESTIPIAKVSESAKFLSKYDVELIVDASMSMGRRDCPGFMSRWNWCGAQSVDLARQLSPFASQGVTITSFNRNFNVYEHQNPQQLTTLFARTFLAPNTRLAEPLADRLNDYLVHREKARPRLIAVITDGVPHPFEQVQMVKDVLIHASKMLKDPRELTVVFLQIGGRDFAGQEFLSEIDNKLVGEGARFDIVQTVSFEHLQQVGLAQGLADAIRSFDYRTRN